MTTADTAQPEPGEPAVKLTTEQLLLIRQASGRLQKQFEGTFNRETIERYLIDSQARFESRGRLGDWLPALIERFTHDRLLALARLEVDTQDRPGVLFLCVHNAGRSQMAAGYLRHMALQRVDIFTGGSDPGHEVNDVVVAAMAEDGLDISTQYPKPWTDEIARAADVIVTMGCGDACPAYPGKRYEDWVLDDPSGQPIEVVRAIRDDIKGRVEELLATLEVGPL